MFETLGTIFNQLFLGPFVNLLVVFTQIFQSLHIPGALGMSVIILTILTRLVLWPLTNSQLKSAQKMNSIKPHLDELKAKHKGDKKALQVAQMELYKEHGINPAAGCLPMLIQLPLVIALYRSIIDILPGAGGGNLQHINSLLYSSSLKLSTPPDPNFFGINLGVRPADFANHGILLLLIPLVTAILTFIQSKMMAPQAPIKEYPSDSPKEKKQKEGMEEAMTQMQSQMVYLMPLMIGYFAFTFPVGLALYWNTYTILGIIQQHRIGGWGALTTLIKLK